MPRAKPKYRNDAELTSRDVRMARRVLAGCTFCRPHKGENARKRPRPDTHKNHRRQGAR